MCPMVNPSDPPHHRFPLFPLTAGAVVTVVLHRRADICGKMTPGL
mgnify:FL=1